MAEKLSELTAKLHELQPKAKEPNSAKVLTAWIAQAERGLSEGLAGRLGWLVASPVLDGFGLPTPDYLAGLAMAYQIAQKLHAGSDPHEPPDYVNDRARDLVDLLLLKDLAEATGEPTLAEIRHAGKDIFDARIAEAEILGRRVRHWPPVMTAFPHWAKDYAAAAATANIAIPLNEAITVINQWIKTIDEA